MSADLRRASLLAPVPVRAIVPDMMVKLYWFFRIVAYAACLGGVFWFFLHRTDADGGQSGLFAVYAGFLAFFISYAIRFFIRFGGNRRGQ